MLIWRVRLLLRENDQLGMGEAVSLSVLIATILGGSVLLFLASSPWVYDEDVAWAIPVTIATLFVFLGILDRPTKRRIILLGVLLVAGILGRQPPALACIAGAFLIAAWFYFGRGGEHNKLWAAPTALAAAIPIPVWCAINWLKFGTPFNSLPLSSQVWSHLNAHRREFLAASGGKGYSLHFTPTTLWSYFQPSGLRVQLTFPFFTLPVHSPNAIGGYIFDALYPTPSVPASMPLLFLLSCCAVVVSFKRNPSSGARLMRIPLIAALGAGAVDLVYGYIAPRYLGDFVPFLVLGGAVGLIAIWRRLKDKGTAVKRAVVVTVIFLGLLSIAINTGLALSPTTQWSPSQASNYVTAVRSVSGITGHPMARQIEQTSTLPYWAPANDVYIIGDCEGVYLSTGESVAYAPGLQNQHDTWDVVEQGGDIHHALTVTFNGPVRPGIAVPVFSYGSVKVIVQTLSRQLVLFGVQNPNPPRVPWPPVTSPVVAVAPHKAYRVEIWADPNLNRITVLWEELSGKVISRTETYLPAGGAGKVLPTHNDTGSDSGSNAVSVTDVSGRPKNMSLCRALQREAAANAHT